MGELTATKFRVRNFRNVDDSGWIPLERVTAFVGRNESGKTALLKALHKFNPAVKDAYDPQREFPRDRFTRDFRDGADWPVCSIEFNISEPLRAKLGALAEGQEPPQAVVFTRYYDQSVRVEFPSEISDGKVTPDAIVKALKEFAGKARRLPLNDDSMDEDAAQAKRGELAEWATAQQDRIEQHDTLRTEAGVALLVQLANEANAFSSPFTADIIEGLLAEVEPVHKLAQASSVESRFIEELTQHLPVVIYFENFGILDSAVYLPRLIEDAAKSPNNARVRTILAMFRHVNLTPDRVQALGNEKVLQAKIEGREPTPAEIAEDQRSKDAREITLNSASIDITTRFGEWWNQRRHKIRYHADGDYFRIWIADERRPDVEIELESRSKGFQWFFSFYLVFLVESEYGHKDALLLLDEPGIHLHPTAQQELIKFFEMLSESNQLAYSTHSPFLIDGEHLHRVRPVTEDKDGRSEVAVETWPADRETIFPLQAAAGYEMMKFLFRERKNALVEGLSDYLYIHGLSLLVAQQGKPGLPADLYVVPCGGTRMVSRIAALFLGEGVRPLVILDADEAGQIRRNELLKNLYVGHEDSIVLLSDILDLETCEIEDVIGEGILVPIVSEVAGTKITLNADDRKAGSLPDQIEACAARKSITLPQGWRALAASRLVVCWAENKADTVTPELLERGAKLVDAIAERSARLAAPIPQAS